MQEPLLAVSDAATAKLRDMVESGQLADSAVRVNVREEGAAFHYELRIVKTAEQEAGDHVVESPAVSFLVGPESAELLRGATLDYVDAINGAGFKFENPNQPALLAKPMAAEIQRVIDEQVNPSVAAHGGHVTLVDVEEGKVFVKLGGGCQGCGMANATLRDGIEQMLRREVPDILEVHDVTDHASGENPYYQA